MFHKALALVFALILYNAVFYNFFPLFGTTGFLLLTLSAHFFIVLAKLPKYTHFFTNSPTKHPNTPIGLASIAQTISLTAATLSVFKGSQIDQLLLGLTSLGLTGLALYLTSLEHQTFGAVSELFTTPLTLAKNYFTSSFKTLESIVPLVNKHFKRGVKPQNPSSPIITPIIRGLVITIPFAFLVIVLLTTADPVFGKLISNLLNIKLPVITLSERLIKSVLLTLVLTPITLLSIDKIFRSPLNHPTHAKSSFEITMLTGALAAILGTFLIIQFRYLFTTVPETQLHQFGINTYSEYVRRGFVELTLVSILVYFAAGLSFIVSRAKDVNKSLQSRINLVLLSEITIFILSIFRRVVLYATHHGLTRIRVYGSIFLFTLLGLTIILVLRQISKTKRNWYLIETSVVLAGIFLATNIGVDRLIAGHFPPHVNDEIDYVYLSRLSSDAHQGWIESYDWAKNTLAEIEGIPDENLTDNQIRHTYYAFRILETLRYNYTFLAQDYGTKEDLLKITPFSENNGTPLAIQPKVNERKLLTNFTDQQAYLTLRSQIPPEEIRDLHQKHQTIRVPDPQYLDRSLESPLID